MSTPKSWLSWSLLIVAAALTGAWIARATLTTQPAPAPVLQSGTWLPEARDIAIPALTDSAGAPFTGESFAGHASLLFFGFTRCPDVCPNTLALLTQVMRSTRAANLTVYLVSVDPERDTPEVLRAYLAGFDPQFIGLTGDPLDIKALARTVGTAMVKVDLPGNTYTMDHSATLYLLDDAGRLRAVFTQPLEVETLASDLAAAVAATRG